MLIRDLESKTKLDRATIRFYEREGLIHPKRKENGYRTYSVEDCDTLLKIKLLRQLEMPLEKIKELQQGSGDLNSALAEQIRLLEAKQEQLGNAVSICAEMRIANVKYDTLNAAYYLDRLSRPVQNVAPAIKKEFREQIHREYHPVRRCVARLFDYNLMECLLLFLVYVVLRVRISGDWLRLLIGYGLPFLMVPIEALMLHLFGTTPGKWCMGLRVESIDGGYLSFNEAMEREKTALSRGFGYGIPIYSTWCMYTSYKRCSYIDQEWDCQSEYIYQSRRPVQTASFTAAIVLIIALVGWCASDMMLPRYRGDLTVSNFADNYNYYLSILVKDAGESSKLQSNGSPYPISRYTTVLQDAQPKNERFEFEYDTEGETLKKISYSNSWTKVSHFTPLGYQCQTAAVTAVMSQDGINISDLYTFVSLWDQNKANTEGNIVYQNVEINWNIDSTNCLTTNNGMYYKENEDEKSSVTIYFEIIFHE